MGKVFLALDQKTGKEVAVKIVKDQKQWDRERVMLQKLKHTKGVPELFFAGKEKELFLVMEYILGNSLKRYGSVCGKLYKKKTIGDNIRKIEPKDIKNANNLMYMTSVLILIVLSILLYIVG